MRAYSTQNFSQMRQNHADLNKVRFLWFCPNFDYSSEYFLDNGLYSFKRGRG